jgi:flavin reductase (DIM6/NTAB) family NADH-FMN oxidoreductase RutF
MERSPHAPPQEFNLPISGGFVTGAPEGIGESYLDALPEPELLEIGSGAPDADTRLEFRRTLGMFATGVTVITTRAGEQVHGMTVNAFMSVSLEPPLVLISVDRRARMNMLLHEGAHYGISVLAAEQELLSDHFAGRARQNVPEPQFDVVHDTPLVQGAIAHLVARVVRSYWGGDHSLFLGQVEYARYAQGRPLLFLGGKYERLLRETPVFSTLPEEVLARIFAAGTERSYEDDEVIVRRGDVGDELYVLLEGAARIERAGLLVGALAKGDVFGEISVLDGGTRTADVIAAGPARCLAVPREVVQMAIEADPRAAWELLGVLARRLRET